MEIGCVVLAAGNARRFGGNKLLREVGGRSLIRRALEAVPGEMFHRVAVVTQYREAAELAAAMGYLPVWNDAPEEGVSRSIRLGLEALGACDGAMFLVADQPFLRRESVRRAVRLFLDQPGKIVVMGHGGQRGNPCLFPAGCFGELAALRGDRGGRSIFPAHEGDIVVCEAAAEELLDVDTVGEWEDVR